MTMFLSCQEKVYADGDKDTHRRAPLVWARYGHARGRRIHASLRYMGGLSPQKWGASLFLHGYPASRKTCSWVRTGMRQPDS